MLSIKRPTSTTVLFTVSTRSPVQSLSAQLIIAFSITIRIAVAILVLTALLHEYRNWSPVLSPDTHFLSWLETAVLTSPARHFATLLSQHLSRVWRLCVCAGIGWLVSRKGYTEERLLVIRGLGVQTTTSSPSYLWTSSTRFIPTSSVQDIFIYEAFEGFAVRYYLCIVVEEEEDVVVVFPVRLSLTMRLAVYTLMISNQKILPRRDIVEEVWRGARRCLYEPKS